MQPLMRLVYEPKSCAISVQLISFAVLSFFNCMLRADLYTDTTLGTKDFIDLGLFFVFVLKKGRALKSFAAESAIIAVI